LEILKILNILWQIEKLEEKCLDGELWALKMKNNLQKQLLEII